MKLMPRIEKNGGPEGPPSPPALKLGTMSTTCATFCTLSVLSCSALKALTASEMFWTLSCRRCAVTTMSLVRSPLSVPDFAEPVPSSCNCAVPA